MIARVAGELRLDLHLSGSMVRAIFRVQLMVYHEN